MITFPNAKINLGLNITEKRPDGYHNLETIFYPVPLEDAREIHVASHTKEKITLQQKGIVLDGNPYDNLVVKAYRLLDKEFDLPPVDIHLYKRIPCGAGLGGGSSDAASMLKLLNKKFSLELTDIELEKYAAMLGADCAFFIKNIPTYAEGIGNIFSPVTLSLKGYKIILVKPDIFVSTREAFSLIKPHKPEYSLKELAGTSVHEWKNKMVNDFEDSVFPQFPIIKEIKDELYRNGAIYASMSGSGSSVFGLFAPEAILPDINFGSESFVFRGSL